MRFLVLALALLTSTAANAQGWDWALDWLRANVLRMAPPLPPPVELPPPAPEPVIVVPELELVPLLPVVPPSEPVPLPKPRKPPKSKSR